MSRSRPNRSTKEQLAHAISLVFHPFLVAPLTIVLVLHLNGLGWVSAVLWALACAVFVVLPAVIYLIYQLARNQYTDADISVREHRYGIYIFGTVCMAACLGVMYLLEAPHVLLIFLTGGLLTIMAFGLITRFWTKISVHVGLITACTAAAAFYSASLGVIFSLATIAVAWSRLVLKRHTPAEIIVGWATATLLIGLTLAFA